MYPGCMKGLVYKRVHDCGLKTCCQVLFWQRTPFLLYLPHTAVHTPIAPGEAFRGKSANGRFGDWVEEVDWSVGQVLDALRESGLDKKTLVIFTSDNGGTARAVNAPLRGNKGSTWEGGMRVPTLAWWPGRIPAGSSTDAVTGMMDVLPTLVKLAGGSLEQKLPLDGRDIWPVLTQGAKSPHDALLLCGTIPQRIAIRAGDWKLLLNANNAEEAGNTGGTGSKRLELYNLAADPSEKSNRAADEPDRVKALHAQLTAWRTEVGAKMPTPAQR
jgi:arylsulfatase A